MNTFDAVADPTRRRVLDLLREREQAAGELVAAFPTLTQPAISRHLRVLREAGLVRMRKDEQRRIYALIPQGLAELDAWITAYRPFWQTQLDSLTNYLDSRSEGIRQPDTEEESQ